jgi:phosphatidylinositol-3-phosphatase
MIRKTLTAALVLLGFKSMAQSTSLPKPDHVVIVVLQNTGYGTLLSSERTPYLKSLASDPDNALFTNSYGVTHPSQPNYLYLFSGSNQGITDNRVSSEAPFCTPNLGSELLKAGYTFAGYSQNTPEKPSPWDYWLGNGPNGIPEACSRSLEQFPEDFSQLPTVSLVIPALANGLHDSSYAPAAVQKSDNWIKSYLEDYAEWCKTHNSLLIITWDEDYSNPNNQVATLLIGEPVKGGKYGQKINHVNLLRTLEEMYGLGYAGSSAFTGTIGEVWKKGRRMAGTDSPAYGPFSSRER